MSMKQILNVFKFIIAIRQRISGVDVLKIEHYNHVMYILVAIFVAY